MTGRSILSRSADRCAREHVSYSDKNRPFRPDSITTGWEQLCKEAEVETFQANGKRVPAEFRLCRNVGSSIGLKHSKEISVDQREYFLRHSNDAMHKRYEDQGMVIDETFVLDLVNLIRTTYFGGEKVEPLDHGD